MSDISSDSYSAFDLAEFTEEDFAQIDAAISSQIQDDDARGNSSFQSEIDGLNLSPEEFAQLDDAVSVKLKEHNDGPSVHFEIKDGEATPLQVAECANHPSPLKQFRSRRILSVSDLVSPAWCEVQFDYGLRGKRSRPIGIRPTSFVSSSGKTISVAKSIAEKNDVRTKQGLAVHKELERELRMVELQVDISTEETRWALRLVNMLACLKCMLVDGFTREMPVFGIVHDEVLVGIVDEVIKAFNPPVSANSPEGASPKRPLDKPHSPTPKRARRRSISPENVIISCLESGETALDSLNRGKKPVIEEPISSPSKVNPPVMLYLKDNKTRRYPTVPPHQDTLSGRFQLMLYRRLLSQLVAKSPLYDFRPLWKRLGVESSSPFPTKFLVQANLISDNIDFQTTCLDDVVTSWHNLVKEANIQGVNENLELVYRLRPAPDRKQKGKAISLPELNDCDTANTPKDIPAQIVGAENSTAGPSNHMKISALITEGPRAKHASSSIGPSYLPSLSDLEDAQLQWALQQSMMPQSDQKDRFPCLTTKPSLQKRENLPEPDGIHRFEIVGRKEFIHDDIELDAYLSHIFKWWRGERKPEGVPLEHASRCLTCEYANDCEWRAQKALELSNVHRRGYDQ